MSTLNYTCNITTADILPGEGIVFIPVSSEFHTNLSHCSDGDDNSHPVPFERRFHGIEKMTFEPFTIKGLADTYPMVRLDECQKHATWKFMKAFFSQIVPSIQEAELTHQLNGEVSTSDDFLKNCHIEKSTHYPWISMMEVALQLCEKEGEEVVRSKCQEQIIYHFIDNLYFGIPFMGSTKTTPQMCNMKIAAFSEKAIDQMKSLPVDFGKSTGADFSSFGNFMEYLVQRYCTENVDSDDLSVKATQLTMNYLRLHKVLFKPMSATFAEDKVSQELPEIQKAIRESKDPMATFKLFAQNLCLIEYMKFFNIQARPMTIVDVGEHNYTRSLNYQKLLNKLSITA